ncbi:MAG: hypothetical protein KJ646_03435 [Nanoarchaeota archaeon]|nr:hypothetical protein [Nanoarchaeota archaeon]MBU4116684.1 hypothetical protein [Nanoarchaeota archaeon]
MAIDQTQQSVQQSSQTSNQQFAPPTQPVQQPVNQMQPVEEEKKSRLWIWLLILFGLIVIGIGSYFLFFT